MIKYINDNKIPCPNCGKCNYTDIREFNLMFETHRGVIKDEKSVVYLRPENAQGEYVNFLKKQPVEDLAIAFSDIEKQLDKFSNDMQAKYDEYLKAKKAEERFFKMTGRHAFIFEK